MTEEQLAAIFGGISQELSTLDDRTDTLARKLADVTAALVAADGALAQRVADLEAVPTLVAPHGTLRIHTVPARRGLLSRVTRRTRTHQGAGPEGTE